MTYDEWFSLFDVVDDDLKNMPGHLYYQEFFVGSAQPSDEVDHDTGYLYTDAYDYHSSVLDGMLDLNAETDADWGGFKPVHGIWYEYKQEGDT